MSENEVPFGNDDEYDDFEIGGGYASGTTIDEVKERNSFPDVPLGRNDFFLKTVKPSDTDESGAPVPFKQKCFLLNETTGIVDAEDLYSVYRFQYVWAMKDNPDLSVNEFFKVPIPGDEDSAMLMQTSATSEGGRIGRDYDKYLMMLSALGFESDDGSIPDEARVFKDQKYWPDGERRYVSLDIKEQRDYKTKEKKIGPNGKAYREVGMLSYQKSHDTLVRLGEIEPEEEDVEEETTAVEADPEPEPEKPRTASKTQATRPATASKPATKTATASKPATVSKPASGKAGGAGKMRF